MACITRTRICFKMFFPAFIAVTRGTSQPKLPNKLYQFPPLPYPLPPGAGEKRFLPLDGGGPVGVLNCYNNVKNLPNSNSQKPACCVLTDIFILPPNHIKLVL